MYKSLVFLFLFITYLITPAVVSIIQKNDKTIIMSLAEEEKSSNTGIQFEKDIKITQDFIFPPLFEFRVQKAEGYTYNRFAHRIYLDPVSPPPKNS